MRAWAVLKDAWQQRDKIGDANKSRELAAFLPAALEIQDAPPNPVVRWLAWCLLAFFLIAIVWASFGQVNIVASAEGKIIPSSRIKQVQPLQKGVVRAILVGEGDYVDQGQALIELDTTLTHADKKRIESELHSIDMRLSVNQALLSILTQDNIEKRTLSMDDMAISLSTASETEKKLHTRLLWQQWNQYHSQMQSLLSSLDKTKAEQLALSEVIAKLEQTLPIATKRAEDLKQLHAKQFISESDYLLAEQERIQQYHDLAAEKQRVKQLHAAESEIREQVNLHIAQSSGALLTEISDQKRQLTSLQEELNKAHDLNEKQILYSPVAGRVQELSISTVGGVVTEAQQLMKIVPDEEQLEVEVFIENKDIGFVFEDMAAEIKIHTFPFTKYGVLAAEVTNVSDDATVDENRGLIYSMQLRMTENTIWVEGKEVNLMPGMAVTAEIKTGKRRIMEFFLAPLMRAKSESIRER